jgi:predicted GNAT family N-acyltransferase
LRAAGKLVSVSSTWRYGREGGDVLSRNTGKFSCRAAGVDEILALRHAVLIVGTTRTSAVFDGDTDVTTRHYGAFERTPEGRCVACVSYMRADLDREPAYQLRGMAVASELQGRGVGSELLAFAEARLRAELQVKTFWCNARIRAVAFYERHGWQAVSDVFEIEGIGPHRRLVKRLEAISHK